MKIQRIETLVLSRGVRVHAGEISWLWVRVHTDDGRVGLGETYPMATACEAVIHAQLAPLLLGRDPRQIDRLWADMKLACETFGHAGAEMRALSAIDIALWDLLGKIAGLPVYQLLGGACRDRIPTYNTCYDHLFDFTTHAGPLAKSLLEQGIGAMKIWPFDQVALRNRGQYLSPSEIEEGLAPIRQIRDAVGDRMAIALEFHGYWNLPCAVRIAQAVEPYQILWLEEMMPQDSAPAYRHLAQTTRIPLILSERYMTRWQFREVLESGAAKIVNPDLCWCGGLSEAKRIATLAETWQVPVAPHNCGGPVLHLASLHLARNLPNLFLLESVRRHYLKEYQGLVTETGAAREGFLTTPESPGLGLDLDAGVFQRSDVSVREVNL